MRTINKFGNVIKELSGEYLIKYRKGGILSAISTSIFYKKNPEDPRVVVEKFNLYIIGVIEAVKYFRYAFNDNWIFVLIVDDSITRFLEGGSYVKKTGSRKRKPLNWYIKLLVRKMFDVLNATQFVRVIKINMLNDFVRYIQEKTGVRGRLEDILMKNGDYAGLLGAFFRMLPIIDNKLVSVGVRNARQLYTTTDSYYSEKFLKSDKIMMVENYHVLHEKFEKFKRKETNIVKTILGGYWNIKVGEKSDEYFRRVIIYILTRSLEISNEQRYSYGSNEVVWTKTLLNMVEEQTLREDNILVIKGGYEMYNIYDWIIYSEYINSRRNKDTEIGMNMYEMICESDFYKEYEKELKPFLDYKEYDHAKKEFEYCLGYIKNRGTRSCFSAEWVKSILSVHVIRSLYEFVILNYILPLGIDKLKNIIWSLGSVRHTNMILSFIENVLPFSMFYEYKPILIFDFSGNEFPIDIGMDDRINYMSELKYRRDYQLYIVREQNKQLILDNVYEAERVILQMNKSFKDYFENMKKYYNICYNHIKTYDITAKEKYEIFFQYFYNNKYNSIYLYIEKLLKILDKILSMNDPYAKEYLIKKTELVSNYVEALRIIFTKINVEPIQEEKISINSQQTLIIKDASNYIKKDFNYILKRISTILQKIIL